MPEAEELTILVGDIYDAALDPLLWPSVLDGIASFVGGPVAAMFSKDPASKTGRLYHDNGAMDPRYVSLYFDDYVRLDPATTVQYFADVGEPMATADLVPYNEFLDSRFYREWAHPQGFVDFVSAILEKSATGIAMIGVFRHARDGLVDDEARRRMRLIVPHVRRSALIGKVLEHKTAEAAVLSETLECIRAGVFMIDAGGGLIHANTAGQAMLITGDLMHVSGRRLATVDPKSDRALRAVLVAAAGGDAALGEQGIALPLIARDGDVYVCHILPLTSGERRQARSDSTAAAALFVHKAALATPSSPEVIARAFALTPTELRILLALVAVGGVPEIAETLGIAEATVRFHLRHLFEKTGTHRQADLVKLVAGFSSPLTD